VKLGETGGEGYPPRNRVIGSSGDRVIGKAGVTAEDAEVAKKELEGKAYRGLTRMIADQKKSPEIEKRKGRYGRKEQSAREHY
jgi:hypothetical protein